MTIFRDTIQAADGSFISETVFDTVAGTVDGQAPTGADIETLANYQTQVADNARRNRLDQAAAVLEQWAEDARGTTVTNGNNTQVTQVLVDRLGIFFDRFADLLAER